MPRAARCGYGPAALTVKRPMGSQRRVSPAIHRAHAAMGSNRTQNGPVSPQSTKTAASNTFPRRPRGRNERSRMQAIRARYHCASVMVTLISRLLGNPR